MKKTISVYDFEREFKDCGRGEQFSYAGFKALYEYLEEMESGTGEEMELDPIALCCEYCEYESALACINDCGYDFEPEEEDEEDQEEEALDYLRENTSVIEFNGGIIIQNF